MTRRILVVDDEAHILQVLSLKLRNAGHEVITAADGEEGCEAAVTNVPDLVVTDFQMPYMTGLELCRALLQKPETAGIPVIMLTARGYSLDDADLALNNLKGVFTKPFSPRHILEQIERVLAGQPAVSDKSSKAEAA